MDVSVSSVIPEVSVDPESTSLNIFPKVIDTQAFF